jgi:hypothetical protein
MGESLRLTTAPAFIASVSRTEWCGSEPRLGSRARVSPFQRGMCGKRGKRPVAHPAGAWPEASWGQTRQPSSNLPKKICAISAISPLRVMLLRRFRGTGSREMTKRCVIRVVSVISRRAGAFFCVPRAPGNAEALPKVAVLGKWLKCAHYAH